MALQTLHVADRSLNMEMSTSDDSHRATSNCRSGHWRGIPMLVYELAALADLSLVIVENCGYVHLSGLPLGGGQIQQIGILFATAYVISRLMELLR